MKKKVIIIISSIVAIAVIAILMVLLINDGNNTINAANKVTKLSFKQSVSVETIDSLNGKTVSMTGYMSTLSPLDGTFMYLMNLPYQSCPFCIPNTNTLSNTIAIYAKKGKKFEFTDNPITITGTLVTGDFNDEFGYDYTYKIIDATVKNADVDELSKNVRIYSAVSSDGLLQEILMLVSQTDLNVFYELYEVSPEDLQEVSIADIDKCINKLSAISKEDYADLIESLKGLKEINEVINENIANNDYEKNIDMGEAMDEAYYAIGDWLNKYEL